MTNSIDWKSITELPKLFFTVELEDDAQKVKVGLRIRNKSGSEYHKGITITRENFGEIVKLLERKSLENECITPPITEDKEDE
jgi:hypothetical protein